MRPVPFVAILLLSVAGAVGAQQPNMGLSAIAVDALPVLGPGPVTASVFTDSAMNINVQSLPNMPIVCIYGLYSANATITPYNFTIDIANQGFDYANQILFSGFAHPSPKTWTDPQTGIVSFSGVFPACTFNAFGALSCLTLPTYTSSVQAICPDPSNAPFNVRSTAACTITISNGYTLISLPQVQTDGFMPYSFLGGFTFNFYGTTYTNCFVSENGFVSFGATNTNFPMPDTGPIRAGVRRIMSFYTDLDVMATPTVYNARIYVQMYTENGQRHLHIVHYGMAEFGNATGPHGGEMTLDENGDILIFVPPYQVVPSISTAIGITPGNNLDPGGVPGQFLTGRDLSADFTLGPTPLGINRMGFEVFNYSAIPVTNLMDLIGLGFNVANPLHSGIRFIRNPIVSAPNQAEYIVSP